MAGEYRLIERSGPESLERAVNELLNEGWELRGTVMHYETRESGTYGAIVRHHFIQAMSKSDVWEKFGLVPG
jgi:hypothetical protein